MRIKVTHKELIKKLHKINYVEARMVGSHLILVNNSFNSTIVLPIAKPKEIVAEYFLRTIRKNMIEKGILTEEEFYNLMMSED